MEQKARISTCKCSKIQNFVNKNQQCARAPLWCRAVPFNEDKQRVTISSRHMLHQQHSFQIPKDQGKCWPCRMENMKSGRFPFFLPGLRPVRLCFSCCSYHSDSILGLYAPGFATAKDTRQYQPVNQSQDTSSLALRATYQ